MYDQPSLNAVAAIRVSTTKQGTEGDSPEAQREQLEQFAASRNINIKEFFIFLESASNEVQPIQKAIDYCKKPKNDIQLFLVKSIDRFTRGGSYSYSNLKMQLDKADVRLMDIYGIIGTRKVNTLEHLGLSYKWSVYDPTKNSEILEAERAHDEKRDIMSRMIGAEIRYARLGYWMRRPPLGFTTKTVETLNGKRCVLEPNPTESYWMTQMFELRARGTISDQQIVDTINGLGFKSRIMYARDLHDRTRITAKKGGNLLTVKGLWSYIKKPIYAGVLSEKWTLGRPVRCKFPGLVSIETFNKANRGKVVITEANGELQIHKPKKTTRTTRVAQGADYPYRHVVMCPYCNKPFTGSASRGRLGKYYPAYHCNRNGHYFRIPKKIFEQTIEAFVSTVEVAPEFVQTVIDAVTIEWAIRQHVQQADQATRSQKIGELQTQAKLAAEKIKYLEPSTIKYIESEISDIEREIARLGLATETAVPDNIDPGEVRSRVVYLMNNLADLIFERLDPLAKANSFGLLFEKAPTYKGLQFFKQVTLSTVFRQNEI